MNTDQNPAASPTSTTPREWFTLFLRVFGIWELSSAADEFVSVFNINAGFWHPQYSLIQSYGMHGLCAFLIGVGLLRGASAFARLFYPDKTA